jgi:hypothetical protein
VTQRHYCDEALAAAGIKSESDNSQKKKPKQADILIEIGLKARLFHTPPPDSDAFADIMIKGHRETHRIRGSGFRLWLRHQYFEQTKSGCSSDALQVAVETIAANAQFEGDECEVHCRVAEHAGAIYIDLGDENWRAIKVTKSNWEIVDKPPVHFRRSPSMQSLPVPQVGGAIEMLKEFCNVKTDGEFILLVAVVLSILRPNSNYPVLVVTGEQGSAKSTLIKIIVRLTDPRIPEQRTLPRDEDDLIVAAKGAHLLPYDNVSGVSDWLSDAFCRLATGGGAGKRRLYTDDDEVLFAGRRPVILNGIEDVVRRPDLVDRSVMLTLEAIPEDKRRDEKEIDVEFEQAARQIFGVLLAGLVAGLKNLATIDMPAKPRMADFALWAEACTRAYWPADTFLKSYQDNLANSVELVLESNPIGDAVRRFMAGRNEWEGTAGALLPLLTAIVGDQVTKERSWPKGRDTLGGKLRRAAPALRKTGIDVTFHRGARGVRIIHIATCLQPDWACNSVSQASQVSHPSENALPVSNLSDATAIGMEVSPGVTEVSPGVTPNPLKSGTCDTCDSSDGKIPTQSSPTPWDDLDIPPVAADPLPDELPELAADSPLSPQPDDGMPDFLRRCVQCGALGDDRGPVLKHDDRAWLHLECRRFWLKDHPPMSAGSSQPAQPAR